MGSHGGEDGEDSEAGVEEVEEICAEGIGYNIVQLQLDTWIYRSPDASIFTTTVASRLFEYSNSRLAYASHCRKKSLR